MYRRWAERMGFAVEWIDGPDRAYQGLLRIAGPFAFGLLSGESGTHQSARTLGGARQVSSATVEVLPDGDFEWPPAEEMERVTYRLGGHCAYVESGVMVTHLPTGLFAESHRYGSQYKNHHLAMRLLAA